MAGPGADDIQLDLDPAAVLKALQEMKAEFTGLANHVEEQLGRKAPRAIGDLENASKNGTNKITEYFRNLGTRVREDLKTAFDATGILAGAKFAKDMGEGVRQVFELERAFDRLNTRLKLSSSEMATFKTEMGRKVANTGADMREVMPGVEAAAARGNIRNPAQLANIGEALGRVNQTTGEDTTALSETVVEILKNQGEKINDRSFKATLDALQGARVNGAFTNAEEAGRNVEALSKFAAKSGLNTRQLAGLSATASQAGSQGNNILSQLLEQGSTAGGQEKLNAIFGQQIYKGGKLNAAALGKIDTNRFGQYSEQTMGEATGLQGANGADLRRFVESFRGNMDSFNKVVAGANETSVQFDAATDNLASRIDRFKQNVMRSAREVGENLSQAGNHLFHGDVGKAAGDVSHAAGAAWDNAGTLAAAGAITAGVGMLAGRGINGLLGKVGGGVVGGVVKGQAAKAAGAEPVYVVNASEIGGSDGGGLNTLAAMGEVGEGAAALAGVLAAAVPVLAFGAAAATGGAAGYGAATLADKATGGGYSSVVGAPGAWLADKMYGISDGVTPTTAEPAMPTADAIGDAVAAAIGRAGFRGPVRPDYINKSAVHGTGKAM